jgi:hypothetical protein
VSHASALTIPPGARGVLFVVHGSDSAPQATLVGPGGRKYTSEADGRVTSTKDVLILPDDVEHSTSFVVGAPAAGKWTVRSEDGAAVASIDRVLATPKPSVRARVRGRGARRTLQWHLKPIDGQRVTFVEVGDRSERVIASTTRASGRRKFTSPDGPTGKRSVLAVVVQDGAPRARFTVARYRYRRPVPAAPAKLRAARRGQGAAFRWRKVAGAAQYEVSLRRGRQVLTVAVIRGTRLRAIDRRGATTVTVRAFSRDGRRGRSSSARIR